MSVCAWNATAWRASACDHACCTVGARCDAAGSVTWRCLLYYQTPFWRPGHTCARLRGGAKHYQGMWLFSCPAVGAIFHIPVRMASRAGERNSLALHVLPVFLYSRGITAMAQRCGAARSLCFLPPPSPVVLPFSAAACLPLYRTHVALRAA